MHYRVFTDQPDGEFSYSYLGSNADAAVDAFLKMKDGEVEIYFAGHSITGAPLVAMRRKSDNKTLGVLHGMDRETWESLNVPSQE